MNAATFTRIGLSTLAVAGLLALGSAGLQSTPAQADPTPTHPTITLINNTDGSNGGTADDLNGTGTDTFTIIVNGLTCLTPAQSADGGPTGLVLWANDAAPSPTDYPTEDAWSGHVADVVAAGNGGWLGGFGGLVQRTAVADQTLVDQGTGAIAPITTLFPGSSSTGWYGASIGTGALGAAFASAIGDSITTLGVACTEGTLLANHPQDFDPVSGAPLIAWSPMIIAGDGSFTVDGPVVHNGAATASALTATADATAASTADLTATVTSNGSPVDAGSGTVDFFDHEGSSPVNPSPVAVGAGGVATYSAAGLSASAHSFTAVFTPADPDALATSTSDAATLTLSSKAATTVELHGTATGTAIDLTATVQKAGGATATDAKGTVEFDETVGGTQADKGKTVTDGVATDTVTGLTPGQSYSFTATYTADPSEGYASSPATAAVAVPVPEAGAPGALSDGGTVVPGSDYTVSLPAATFGASDAIDVVLHSDPVNLAGATAAADGSVTYTFTAPSTLVAGSSHTLTFTDATDPTKAVQTVAFTVQAAADSGDGSNDAAGGFATDWIATMATTPAGLAGLVGIIVLLAAVLVGGWMWFWRRRRSLQVVAAETAAPVRS